MANKSKSKKSKKKGVVLKEGMTCTYTDLRKCLDEVNAKFPLTATNVPKKGGPRVQSSRKPSN